MSDAAYWDAGWSLADVVRANIRAEAARQGIEQKDIADYTDWRIAGYRDRDAARDWYNQKADRESELEARRLRRAERNGKLPRLDSNQEPADYPYDVVSLDIYRARKRVA